MSLNEGAYQTWPIHHDSASWRNLATCARWRP